MLAHSTVLLLCSWTGTSVPSGTVLYRGDSRPPTDIKLDGGFMPRGYGDKESAGFSLYRHAQGWVDPVASQYVSTSFNPTVALAYARQNVDPADGMIQGFATWVYHIRPSCNFVDVSKTLGAYDKHPHNQEFAALGGVRWEQVLGHSELSALSEHPFSELEFIPNPDYDHAHDQGVASGAVPQLAGFPEGHQAWDEEPWKEFSLSSDRPLEKYASKFMASLSDQVRWHGEFPLITPVSDVREGRSRGPQRAEHRRSPTFGGGSPRGGPGGELRGDEAAQGAWRPLVPAALPSRQGLGGGPAGLEGSGHCRMATSTQPSQGPPTASKAV